MSTIFIDLGAYTGDTIQNFLRGQSFHPDRVGEVSRVYGFELRPRFNEWAGVEREFPQTLITFIRKAVWIKDGPMPMSRSNWNEESHTIMPDCENFPKGEQEQIEAVDFSEWLKLAVKPEDFVIVKIDIEGAEYAVLERLIEQGTIGLIDSLFVEFHDWIMPAEYNARRESILALCPIPIQGWH